MRYPSLELSVFFGLCVPLNQMYCYFNTGTKRGFGSPHEGGKCTRGPSGRSGNPHTGMRYGVRIDGINDKKSPARYADGYGMIQPDSKT